MTAPVPFRVHYADGTKLIVAAPSPAAAREQAHAIRSGIIIKVKRVKEAAA